MLEIVPSSVGRVGARSGVVKRCRAFLRFASHTLVTVCDVSFVFLLINLPRDRLGRKVKNSQARTGHQRGNSHLLDIPARPDKPKRRDRPTIAARSASVRPHAAASRTVQTGMCRRSTAGFSVASRALAACRC